MSDHEIVWTFDTDQVIAKIVCHAEAGANCRLEANHPACDCEAYRIERDEEGPFHLYLTEDDDGNEIEERHDMRDSGEGRFGPTCNVEAWMNEGEVEESAVKGTTFEIARTQIEPVWTGDYYQWKVKSDGLAQ